MSSNVSTGRPKPMHPATHPVQQAVDAHAVCTRKRRILHEPGTAAGAGLLLAACKAHTF